MANCELSSLSVRVFFLSLYNLFTASDGDAAAVFLQPFEAAVAMFLLVFLFGLSTIPFNYVLSFAFQDHATAQITLLVANFTCVFIFTMGFFICNSVMTLRRVL